MMIGIRSRVSACRGFALARPLALILAVLAFAACDDRPYPRDPDDTLARVLSTGRMRVAAADHVPWVVVEEDGVPTGAEAGLVESFARELGVTVEWRRAPAFTALEALERGDADLAIGGFTRKALTALGSAGQTYVYLTERIVVATEPGAPPPQDLEGQTVQVAPEFMANGLVADAGGVPVAGKPGGVRLTALPDWQLQRRGLLPTGIILYESEHVVAVPRGENAWVMRLERFLRTNAAHAADRLREHAP